MGKNEHDKTINYKIQNVEHEMLAQKKYYRLDYTGLQHNVLGRK